MNYSELLRDFDRLSLADKAKQFAHAYEVTGQSQVSKRLAAFLREVAATLDANAKEIAELTRRLPSNMDDATEEIEDE